MAKADSNVPEPDRGARLAAMGLSVELLHDVAFVGQTKKRSATKLHPRGTGNSYFYAEATAQFRVLLMQQGWTPRTNRGVESIVSPNGNLAIVVSSGSQETGQELGLAPRTKNPKGPATQEAVEANDQLSLFDDPRVLAIATEDDRAQTWFFLHYEDPETGDVHMEISLPVEMTGSHISMWRERIPVPPLAGPGSMPNLDESDEDDDIDVNIEWRQA